MQAINQKDIRTDKFITTPMKSIRRVQSMPRVTLILPAFLGLAVLLICSFGCAPDSSPGDGKQSLSASSADVPELTDEMIREGINYNRVRQIPEQNGTDKPISWTFIENEPKEIIIVEKQIENDRATVLLEIKTQSASDAREPRVLAGQIRMLCELKTGWVLRKWEVVETENISMKYKNLPKPPAQNSNR